MKTYIIVLIGFTAFTMLTACSKKSSYKAVERKDGCAIEETSDQINVYCPDGSTIQIDIPAPEIITVYIDDKSCKNKDKGDDDDSSSDD